MNDLPGDGYQLPVTVASHEHRAVEHAACRVLDHLRVPTYLVAIRDSGADGVTVAVELPRERAWRCVELEVTRQALLDALRDPRARTALAVRWAAVLFERDAA